MLTTIRETCRVCESSELINLFSLGDQYVNDFPSAEDRYKPRQKVPLELVLCDHCSLVQLRHTAPQELLYARKYWYKSGVTQTMRNALLDVAMTAQETAKLKAGDVVLDIGSNDGTLLRSYTTPGLVTVGVEPADNLVEEGSQGVTHFIHDFWNSASYFSQVGSKHAKVVTACGMFYDLEDPNQFIADVKSVLAEDGVFIAQLMCLYNMLNKCDIGNICHEHLEYYSIKSLHHLMNKHGLEIYDLETTDVNGESYRLYIRHAQHDLSWKERLELKLKPGTDGYIGPAVDFARINEKELDRPEFYKTFFKRLEYNRLNCVDFVRRVVAKGQRVWVYGASTKGNVILQYYGLDHTVIEAAADRSAEKWGRYTVGTNIPIVSEADAREANPEYFLVLPYAFLKEFVKREQDWRAGGGQFLVPLPSFRVI